MGNDGFEWMDDRERRRAAKRRPEPRRTATARAGDPLVARLVDEGWTSGCEPEPTLREIGAQLRLWVRAKMRRARREAPRWIADRVAARLLL